VIDVYRDISPVINTIQWFIYYEMNMEFVLLLPLICD
jgi:hypothetical protein